MSNLGYRMVEINLTGGCQCIKEITGGSQIEYHCVYKASHGDTRGERKREPSRRVDGIDVILSLAKNERHVASGARKRCGGAAHVRYCCNRGTCVQGILSDQSCISSLLCKHVRQDHCAAGSKRRARNEATWCYLQSRKAPSSGLHYHRLSDTRKLHPLRGDSPVRDVFFLPLIVGETSAATWQRVLELWCRSSKA